MRTYILAFACGTFPLQLSALHSLHQSETLYPSRPLQSLTLPRPGVQQVFYKISRSEVMASPPRRLPPANQDHQQLTGQSGTQSASSLPEHEGSVASEWAQLDQASVAGSFSMPPSADPGSDPVLARLLQSHRQAYPISSNAHSTGQLASVPPITPVLSSIGFDVQGTAASQYNFVQGEQQQRSAEKQHQHSAESQQGADIDAESSTDDYENNDFSNLFSDEPNE